MKIITFEQIQHANISPSTCYSWVENIIKDKNKTDLPAKISLHPAEGVFCNFMPCIVPTEFGKMGGVKVVNRYPLRQPSLDSNLMLVNMDTGDFLALMDANWITAMRTGAVCVHSILNLAKSQFSTIAVMGLGNTARASILILAEVMPERQFDIKLLRYKGQEELFVERFKDYPNLHFTFVDSTTQLVKGSDVVISCVTYLADDICDDDCFDEGVLIVPVHTRGFTNCDLFFDKVYADDTGHVCHFKNFSKFKYFAEVSDVVNGNAVGRENDNERILAYNIGLGIHDIFFASQIYQMMKDRDDLLEIDMHAPVQKFWV